MRADLVRRARELHPPCRVPFGVSGDWRVQPRFVTQVESEALAKVDGLEWTSPGAYTWLSHRDYPNVMSDVDSELVEHLRLIDVAHGRVLITGLGLGLLPVALLATGRVTHIDIVEIERDVIDLVWPHIEDERMSIHHADAYKWDAQGQEWDYAWHDLLYFDMTPSESFKRLKERYRAGKHFQWQEAVVC